ncbi:YqcI/YcgG family protein [Bacillus atrophaeus]|uniref:YqcI/YcgG family protein n=1 Tax=Bacillus atrophaeus TaxID=1452 RepID=UPI001EFBCE51|nr:YqcI/YcgG family protein [Bacillus atrophaeus]MCG8397249.1 YqcI/YcgG family protein [Bacillus atrophaeus]
MTNLIKGSEDVGPACLLPWQRDALNAFSNKMKDKEHLFPCIPATQSFSLGHLRYGFVGQPQNDQTSLELASLLKEFTINCRDYGKYTTLIIFFDTPQDLINNSSVEDFELLFWEQLNNLHDLDEGDWPSHIPQNPSDHEWEYCFHGEQYFMYCATPKHEERKSRHFPYMMMAITPRWVLQEFNKNEKYAKKIKEQVRKRINKYDTISIHPALNSYGNVDNHEWKQYFLRDSDTELPKCPFLRSLTDKEDRN